MDYVKKTDSIETIFKYCISFKIENVVPTFLLIVLYIIYESFLSWHFLFFFFPRPLRWCSLPLTLPKEKKNDHQWPIAAAKAAPKTSFTLRRGHCISSLWFWVLYTIRETSLVTNYRNDPWKYSLLFFFFCSINSILQAEIRMFTK